MDTYIVLPNNSVELAELVKTAQEWAHVNGFVMRFQPPCTAETVIFLPFTIIPSKFPEKYFSKVKNIQADINRVIHQVAHDYEFLKNSLKSVIKVDDFTAKLFSIYETVLSEGVAQPYSLALLRSDYMLHQPNGAGRETEIKQVEVNTIAVGLGAMCIKMTQLHRYILRQLHYKEKADQLPQNNALDEYTGGLIAAWKLYGESSAVVLFVVEDDTFNVGDQRLLEFEMTRREPDLRVIRRTLSMISSRGQLKQKTLIVDGYEVAVAYYRDGYSPHHYTLNEANWDVRLMIERSKAIKCPSIGYHLAGTKKIQQVLTQSEVLEKFLPDIHRRSAVQEVFAKQLSLSPDEDGDSAVLLAKQFPHKFVLKPQREGGGNNLYDEDIVKALTEMKDPAERSAYILMERLAPPTATNYLVQPGMLSIQPVEVVSELGIFGVVLGSKEDILISNEAGYLLRTKLSSSNEGGVARGLSALDTPYLV